jgi:exopolysaccharide biosynthesis polyprenyl glycosylphosphotransferase
MGLDFVALIAAWRLTIEIRFLLNPVMNVQFSHEKLYAMAPPLVAVIGLWVLSKIWMNREAALHHHSSKLYSMRFSRTIILVSTVTIVAGFFSQTFGAPVSRSFVMLYAVTSYCTLLIAGSVNHYIWRILLKRCPPLVERVAVLGRPEDAETVWAGFHRFSAAKLAGLIVPNGVEVSESSNKAVVPVLGTAWQVAELVNREKLNRVIILNDSCLSEEECRRCIDVLHRMGVTTNRALNFAWSHGNLIVNSDFGMHLLEVRPAAFTLTQEIVKRTFDIAAATLFLILMSPLMIAAALLVKLTSKGAILYHSDRVGTGGRHFPFLKFRTMYHDPNGREKVRRLNEQCGHMFKIKSDPRVTPIGRFLRRYSIDELPQLVNVLRGEMSLVGPRPLPAGDLDADGMSQQFQAWAEQRATVRPGITGLWQIRGRSELSFAEMVQLDLEYVRNWSLLLDFRILVATPLAVLTGKGAY